MKAMLSMIGHIKSGVNFLPTGRIFPIRSYKGCKDLKLGGKGVKIGRRVNTYVRRGNQTG